MRLAFDAMGGDHAPEEAVKGAMMAVSRIPELEVTLFGDEKKIRSYLTNEERIAIVHTEEVIHSDEDPVKAFRRKKNASMVLAVTAVKEGQADVCLSAGSTGAYLAAGTFIIGRIAGISRPALAPTFTTIDGKGFVILDVGATSDAKPEYLKQFALMGSIYAEKVRGIANPRVGLLNIGTEDNKGNDLTKAAFKELQSLGDTINFVGNVEARELLNRVADVVVCDGFTGNMVLKTTEGTALAMFSMLKEALTADWKSKLGAAVLKPRLKEMKKKLDYSEYGGACLFGLKSPIIKAHGSSNAHAFYNAVRQAKMMVDADVAGTIAAAIAVEPQE